MLDAALEAAACLGWPVFPLHYPSFPADGGPVRCSCGDAACKNIGKHPITANGFKDATLDHEQIRAWWTRHPNANIGVPTGAASGMVVWDEDPRHGGDASVAGLEVKHARLPGTVTQRTGGGGRHRCFAHPGGTVKNRTGVLPGIDIRGDGGYIVVAPSLHASGERYLFEPGNGPGEVSLADMPVWLREMITSPKPRKKSPKAAPVGEAGREHIGMDARERRCRAYLEKCPDAVSGSGGHDATLRAGCECFRFGLDDDAVWRTMRWFNDRKTGGEQWSEKELEHKIESAREKVLDAGELGMRLANPAGEAASPEFDRVAALRSDVGNAARLVRRYGDRVRYCYGPGWWLVWDGRRWKPDDRGQIDQLCKKTALAILNEAKHASDAERDAIVAWAMKSQQRERLTAMAALVQSDLAVGPDDLDADRWLFNCRNGTIDLRTGKRRPHREADLITKVAPVNYDENAVCHRFEQFLNEIFGGDHDLVRFVQRWLGHCLTGAIEEQYLPIWHGEGNNGKSVLLETTTGIMGEYASVAPPELLTVRKHPEHPTEIADLLGKRFVVASETERDAELRVQLIKRLTGDRRLKARLMRRDYFEFDRTHKLVLVTNNKPVVKEDTESVWRRLRLVPFKVVIPKEQRDPKLFETLRDEWPGILAWMVKGCLDWQREGLGEPEAVMVATEAYRGAANSVEAFLAERCTLSAGVATRAGDLRAAYAEWCATNVRVPLRGREWGAALRAKGCADGRPDGVRHWIGVALVRPSDDGFDGFDASDPLTATRGDKAVHGASGVKSDKSVNGAASQHQDGSSEGATS